MIRVMAENYQNSDKGDNLVRDRDCHTSSSGDSEFSNQVQY